MAVESQRIISHSNFLFFVLSLSPNEMRDRLPLNPGIRPFAKNFPSPWAFVREISVQPGLPAGMCEVPAGCLTKCLTSPSFGRESRQNEIKTCPVQIEVAHAP